MRNASSIVTSGTTSPPARWKAENRSAAFGRMAAGLALGRLRRDAGRHVAHAAASSSPPPPIIAIPSVSASTPGANSPTIRPS